MDQILDRWARVSESRSVLPVFLVRVALVRGIVCGFLSPPGCLRCAKRRCLSGMSRHVSRRAQATPNNFPNLLTRQYRIHVYQAATGSAFGLFLYG